MRQRRWSAAVALATSFVVMVLVAAVPAGAAHWPMSGGNPGRSGFQPVDEGGVPIQFLYARTALSDRDVRTSVVTSSGNPAQQRTIYGTDDGFVHLRILLTGAPVGPAAGTDVSAAPDPFGGGNGTVSFVETSTESRLGQVFAVHNEVYEGGSFGIEIAQIDEATGERTRADFVVPDTLGYRIRSSPLVTPPDAGGNRSLFFVAEQQSGPAERLFKVVLGNAVAREATIGPVTTTPDVNANAIASPTLVHLRSDDGTPTAFVAVSTFDGLRTFSVAGLVPGPMDTTIGEPLRTPSTPITRSGEVPGSAASGMSTTPAIYVASGGPVTTRVHRLTQDGASQELTRVSSGELPGEPAPALMTDHEVTPTDEGAGRVYVTTSRNLYAVRTTDLALVAKFRPADDLEAGTTGFRSTVPAGTDGLVFVATDGGRHLALQRENLQPVSSELFASPRSAEGATAAFGQPAISHRFLQIATDRGLFVYGLRQASPPTGYWLAASDGGIFAYGDAGFFGSTGDIALNKPIMTMAPTTTDEGYWLAASDGGIFAFGDAQFFGSTGDIALNQPIVGMVPTRSGLGYWLVASDGGIFSFGDAEFFGSTGDIALNKPIVGMAATPTGEGYWLVASDGGIFAFGDAEFFGSTGDIVLNQPIVGMAAVPNGTGYWLVASDGGIFAFGAPFFGSTGDIVLNSPIVAMTASATGAGYAFTASDGGVFVFGDVPFFGSAASLGPLNRPVVTIAAKP